MAISTQQTRHVFRLSRIQVRIISSDEEEQWNELMDTRHPLGNVRYAGHRVKYVAEHCGRAVALVCFSACAYRLADRDRWIGWTGEQAMRRRHFVVQNSRLLILPGEDAHRHNLASRVLGMCARRVAEDWTELHGYAPVLLETFVDPRQHRGSCYRGAGWIEVGMSKGFSRDSREFYQAGSSKKSIFVKPLRDDARELLSAQSTPAMFAGFEKPLPPKRVADRLASEGLGALFKVLQSLPDNRRSQGKRYPLGCCLSIIVCAVLAGCKGLRECAEFGTGLSQPQLKTLRAWKNPKTGRRTAPSSATLWRAAASVDDDRVEQIVNQWFRDEGRLPEAVALDGKTLRATLRNEDGECCAVSAVSHEHSPFFSLRHSLTRKEKK